MFKTDYDPTRQFKDFKFKNAKLVRDKDAQNRFKINFKRREERDKSNDSQGAGASDNQGGK